MNKLILTFTISIYAFTLMAQDTSITLAVASAATWVKNSQGEWIRPAANQKNTVISGIKLEQKGYALLFGDENSFIELTEKGTYSQRELARRLRVAREYERQFYSVYHESLEESIEKLHELKDFNEKWLAIPISRLLLKNDPVVISPRTTRLSDFKAQLAWKSQGSANEQYVVRFALGNGQIIYEVRTRELSYMYDAESLRFPFDQCIYWDVRVAGRPFISSKGYCLYSSMSFQNATFLNALNHMKTACETNSAFRNIVLADYYIQYGMNLEAFKALSKAYQLSGNNEFYHRRLVSFIYNWN